MRFVKIIFYEKRVALLASIVLGFGVSFLIAYFYLNLEHRSLPGKLGIMTVLPTLLGFLFYFIIQNVEKLYSAIRRSLNLLSSKFDNALLELDIYIKHNGQVMAVLSGLALVAYGFELFNLNLTIDEELHSFFTAPSPLWIGEGRWGMYLLNKFFLPYTIIPVMSLFLALVFHVLAVLILLGCWEVNSRLAKVAAGAMMFTFPTLAYIYMFSTLSFGIGIGFFCAALSLHLYKSNRGAWRWLMIIPAGFSIAIYQAFALALVAMFVVYLFIEIRAARHFWPHILNMVLMLMVSFVVYYLVQAIWARLLFSSLSDLDKISFLDRELYTQRYFDFSFLYANTFKVLSIVWSNLIGYYFGIHLDYVMEIKTLGWVMIISFVGLAVNLVNYELPFINKILMLLLSLFLLIVPFLGVFFSHGQILTRTLLALPVSVAGIFIIGLVNRPGFIRVSVLLLALFCVFQFMVSINRLFGSSSLALEADRLVAVRLMEKIDEAKAMPGSQDPLYLEVIGKIERNSTQAIPKRATFGLSFFEVPQIGQRRSAAFLEISGYQSLRALPPGRLAEFVETANSMSIWPAEGSIKIVNDTVLVKFGDYPRNYKREICELSPDVVFPAGFCP